MVYHGNNEYKIVKPEGMGQNHFKCNQCGTLFKSNKIINAVCPHCKTSFKINRLRF